MSVFLGRAMLRAGAVAGGGVLVAGVMLAAAGPAQAQAPACGTTVTASITLTANLDCSTDTTTSALYIGASGITVNLGGHKILGPGYSYDTEGISDYSGDTGSLSDYSVTIENGTISNFYFGADIEGTSTALLAGVVVQNLATTSNAPQEGDGVYGDYLDGATIHKVSTSEAATGVELDNSQASTVTGNHASSPGTGFEDYFGTGNTWSSNTATGVLYQGFYVYTATSPVIRSNTVSGPSGDGIDSFYATGATIAVNTFSTVYDGVYDYQGTDNTVKYNKGSHDAYGIFAIEPNGETYTGNTFSSGNYGIETDYPVSETLTGNTTNDNSETGVYIFDGNSTGSYSASLSYNTANDNHFGLYSQFPTTGKGNKATGNTVLNCYNVTCVHPAAGPAVTAAPPHNPPRAPVRPVRPPGR